MKRDDEVTVTVEDFALDGKCVARVEGVVVFVRNAIPGDRARIRVVRTKKRYAEAEVVELLSASPIRVAPRCTYAGSCGGCRWQHVSYAAQLEFKRKHVQDSLERIGGIRGVTVAPTLPADEPFFYRNKMEFSFGERWLTKVEMESGGETDDRFALGLHIPLRFDKVLDLRECWLQSEQSFRIVNAVREFCRDRRLSMYSTRTHEGYLRNLVIRDGKRTGDLMVNLVTSEDRPALLREFTEELLVRVPKITTVCNNITRRKSQVALGEEERVYYGPGTIMERLGPRTYRVSANSFFQTNTLQAERLYDCVRSMASLSVSDTVLDLYSGTGTIALHLADAVSSIVGIEAAPSAIQDAERNARLNGITNCTFLLGDVKEKLTRGYSWRSSLPAPTVVVLDPPRAGIHEKVTQAVAQMRPDRIVYVSCNPSTQARDLAILLAAAPYRILGAQPVDMFPHTSHIENVVALQLQQAG